MANDKGTWNLFDGWELLELVMDWEAVGNRIDHGVCGFAGIFAGSVAASGGLTAIGYHFPHR